MESMPNNLREARLGAVNSENKTPTTNKRTPAEVERDLAVISSLYLRGYTQKAIAEHISDNNTYSLSRSQVAYDLTKIRKNWLESALVDFNEAKARELAELDELERAYWEGWERSMKEKIKEEAEVIDDTQNTKQGQQPAYQRKKGKKTTETRDGDVHFLDGIRWCIQQRCKIFGIEAPKTIDINWRKEASRYGYDPNEIHDELVGKFLTENEDSATLVGTGNGGSSEGSEQDQEFEEQVEQV